MGGLTAFISPAIILCLAMVRSARDFGVDVYNSDILYLPMGTGTMSEGYISYLDPQTTKRYQFATENSNLGVTTQLSASMSTVTFSRLARTGFTTQPQILILILNSRRLQVLSVAPLNRGAELFAIDIITDATDTSTRCVHAMARNDFIYVGCIRPGATVTQDVYTVKSYRYSGTALEGTYTFSPKDAASVLNVNQMALRIASDATSTTMIILFNRVSLQSLAASVDVTGANTKFLYIVDMDSTATIKHEHTDLTTATNRGNPTVRLTEFGLVYDIRHASVGTNFKLHILTSSGTIKVPSIYAFEYTGTAPLRKVNNWFEDPNLPSESSTYAAELCQNVNQFCIRGVTLTTTRKLFHYSYRLDAIAEVDGAFTAQALMNPWNNAYPIRFEDCDMNGQIYLCTQVYSDVASPADGAPSLNYFELFQIDRTTATPVVNLDRVSRSINSAGGFHEFSSRAVASIVERNKYYLFELSNTVSTSNKFNYIILDAFRFTPNTAASNQNVQSINRVETTISSVPVLYTLKDLLSSITAPASSFKSSIFSTKWRPVMLTTLPTGQALRLSVTGTGVDNLVFQDPEVDIVDAFGNAVNTATNFTYYFGNILVTVPKTLPGTVRTYSCSPIQNYSFINLRGNCSFLTELSTLTGTFFKAKALLSDHAVMLFRTAAAQFTLVTVRGSTIRTVALTDTIIDADFYSQSNTDGTTSPHIAYVYSNGSNYAVKILRIENDGSSLPSVAASVETDAIFTNPVQIVGAYSGHTMAVLDINSRTFQHLLITLKQDATTATKMIRDTTINFWRQGMRETTDLRACFYPDPIGRLVYWYPGSTVAGIANLKNDFEVSSLGLTELGVTEIQSIVCEHSLRKSFALVGKSVAGSLTRSVGYIYKMSSTITALNRLETYAVNFTALYDPVFPIFNMTTKLGSINYGQWCFGGYTSEKGVVRVLLNTPSVYVRSNATGDFTFNVVTATTARTLNLALTMTTQDYNPANLKTVLARGADIQPFTNYSLDSLVDLQAVPVLDLSLQSSESYPSSLVKVNPRLVQASTLETTSARRILEATPVNRRLLQGSTVNAPLFMIVKDEVALVVYKFSTGTKGYIYKRTDTFTKNFDFPGGATLDIKVLDFRVEYVGSGSIHIFYHLGDGNLKYLKVGIEKLDSTFVELQVSSVGVLLLTTLIVTTNAKYDIFMLYTYSRTNGAFILWGVKIATTATVIKTVSITSKIFLSKVHSP